MVVGVIEKICEDRLFQGDLWASQTLASPWRIILFLVSAG